MTSFESRLAHRLRTPLTVIHGFAGVLAKEGESLSTQERRDYAERIKRAADELAEIVNELADGGGSAAQGELGQPAIPPE